MNHDRRPALFRILVWLLWLLAAWGILQYAAHAWSIAHMLDQADAQGARERLYEMLGWDVLYALVAGLTLSAATGVLMWRGWARVVLRWLALLLAVYSLVSAVWLFAHWQSFQHASVDLIAHARSPALARDMLVHVRRATMITLVLKLVAVPVLGWLVWRLGRPALVQRFTRPTRGR